MSVAAFTADSCGHALAAVLHLPGAAPRAWVVASHGLFSSKDTPKMRAVADHLCAHGLAVIRYDHRGCGDSQGDIGATSVASRLADLDAILQYCRRRAPPGAALGLLGSSMGGFISTLRAARDPAIRALAVWSTPLFISHPERDAPEGRGSAPTPLLVDAREYDLRSVAGAVSRCLVVHGACDRLVPLLHAATLHQLLAPPKQVHILPDGDHSLTRPEDRQQALEWSCQWFLQHLSPPASP